MSNDIFLETLKEIRAFQDPYRQRIIKVYEKNDKPLNAKQVADILKEPPSKVHYHVKVLEQHNILKLSHTENINGIIARYMMKNYDNIHIVRSDDSKIKDEVYAMVEDRFDDMKYNFIDRLKALPTNDVKYDTVNAFLKNSIVYLNDEQAKKFDKYLETLHEETKENKDKEGYFGWEIYMPMVKIKK